MLSFVPYPNSKVISSSIYSAEKDLYREKFTDIVFQKEFDLLEPYEFIRSPII